MFHDPMLHTISSGTFFQQPNLWRASCRRRDLRQLCQALKKRFCRWSWAYDATGISRRLLCVCASIIIFHSNLASGLQTSLCSAKCHFWLHDLKLHNFLLSPWLQKVQLSKGSPPCADRVSKSLTLQPQQYSDSVTHSRLSTTDGRNPTPLIGSSSHICRVLHIPMVQDLFQQQYNTLTNRKPIFAVRLGLKDSLRHRRSTNRIEKGHRDILCKRNCYKLWSTRSCHSWPYLHISWAHILFIFIGWGPGPQLPQGPASHHAATGRTTLCQVASTM